MKRISLTVGDHRCRILIGNDILGTTGKLVSEDGSGRRFAIITNPRVNSLYGKKVALSLQASGLDHVTFEVPDAEASKSLEVAKKLYRQLSEKGFDRDSCVIGLGGGVVGDLAGFVAATYMRGINLVNVPTTLLAQVDSAIGGKTGVNLPEGKNLVGAFHQPELVISDIATLNTLPEKEFISGLAEVVKYGVISDPALFSRLETGAGVFLCKDPKPLEEAVSRCSAIKARVVEEDEKDHGKRLILNFGHTLGHALEAASNYEGYRHGEAIALGMLFAAKLSVKLGIFTEKDMQRLSAVISSLELPVIINKRLKTETLIGFMKADKKTRGGRLRLVLPERIGKVVVSDKAGPEMVRATLEEMRE